MSRVGLEDRVRNIILPNDFVYIAFKKSVHLPKSNTQTDSICFCPVTKDDVVNETCVPQNTADIRKSTERQRPKTQREDFIEAPA